MKALLCTAFGPIDRLRIEDVAIPEPAAGQVRIRVKAASLNFPDALIVQGLYQAKPALPFSPGAELAGVIDAVGDGVTAWRPGDAVIASTGHGGFAQQCVADARQIAALPPGMAFDQGAAFVLTYGTSLHALQQRARLQPGETLLVLGAAGGVGGSRRSRSRRRSVRASSRRHRRPTSWRCAARPAPTRRSTTRPRTCAAAWTS